LTDEGEIYSWGRIASNNLRGKKIEYSLDYFTPKRLTVYPMIYDIPHRDEPYFAKIVCGPTHNLALDKSGKVFTWGDSWENCLGYYTQDDVISPRQVISLAGIVVVDAAAGENFCYIIAGDRTLENQKAALQMLNIRYLESMRAKVKNLNNQFQQMHEGRNIDTSPLNLKLMKSSTKLETTKMTFTEETAYRAHTISDLSVGVSNSVGLNLYTEQTTSDAPIYKGISEKKMRREVWNHQINMIVDDHPTSPMVNFNAKKFPINNSLSKSNFADFLYFKVQQLLNFIARSLSCRLLTSFLVLLLFLEMIRKLSRQLHYQPSL
jgi:Regulator of chromosome condensation (RCC1) repeat